jgi:hypothetical protein
MRREFIAGCVGAVAWPREMAAQPAERTYRLGVLSPGASSYETLRGQLADLASSNVGNSSWTCA